MTPKEERRMPEARPVTKVTHMGLTHHCDDPECHVAGFVTTLVLHMPAELAPLYQGATLLRLAADVLEAQPPKLRAQYVAVLRLYADEPWRLTGDPRAHGLNHALMPEATETVEWGVTGILPDGMVSSPFRSEDEARSHRDWRRGSGVVRHTRTSYADRVTDWEEVGDE